MVLFKKTVKTFFKMEMPDSERPSKLFFDNFKFSIIVTLQVTCEFLLQENLLEQTETKLNLEKKRCLPKQRKNNLKVSRVPLRIRHCHLCIRVSLNNTFNPFQQKFCWKHRWMPLKRKNNAENSAILI